MDRPDGLRERKKVATRQALHEAAVRLALEQGFERLTVEAIADAATVSRRTFSNYFANKEEALVYGDHARVRRLVDLVRARPAGEPPWAALTRAAGELAAESPEQDAGWVARTRLLRGHPTLLARQMATYAAAERDLAAEITGRMPVGPTTPLRARLLAAAFLTSLRVATQLWLDHPDTSLTQMQRQVLAAAQERFE